MKMILFDLDGTLYDGQRISAKKIKFLKELKKYFKIGVLTVGDYVKQFRKAKPVYQWLDEFWVTNVKDMDTFWQIADKHKIEPSDMVYIGDNEFTDFKSAKRLGVLTYRIGRKERIGLAEIGNSSKILREIEYEADFIIEDIFQFRPRHILVVPAGSQPALNAIPRLKKYCYVVAADYSNGNAGSLLADKAYKIPKYGKKFEKKIKGIVKREKIDYIIPCSDHAVGYFAKPKEAALICKDKWKQYKKFPDLMARSSLYPTLPLPFFVKPRDGAGSIGAFKIEKQEDLKKINYKNPIYQEYLPGKEYTVDCLSDMEGNLRMIIPRERVKTSGGIAVITKKNGDIHNFKLANEIADKLKIRGIWFFQTKEDRNGFLKLTEICARPSTAMVFGNVEGLVFSLNKNWVSSTPKQIAYRYWTEVME